MVITSIKDNHIHRPMNMYSYKSMITLVQIWATDPALIQTTLKKYDECKYHWDCYSPQRSRIMLANLYEKHGMLDRQNFKDGIYPPDPLRTETFTAFERILSQMSATLLRVNGLTRMISPSLPEKKKGDALSGKPILQIIDKILSDLEPETGILVAEEAPSLFDCQSNGHIDVILKKISGLPQDQAMQEIWKEALSCDKAVVSWVEDLNFYAAYPSVEGLTVLLGNILDQSSASVPMILEPGRTYLLYQFYSLLWLLPYNENNNTRFNLLISKPDVRNLHNLFLTESGERKNRDEIMNVLAH